MTFIILSACLVVACALWNLYESSNTTVKITGFKWIDSYEAVIEMTYTYPWPMKEQEVRRYRGSGTVWHNADTGERTGTSREMFLCDHWTLQRWRQKDGTRVNNR